MLRSQSPALVNGQLGLKRREREKEKGEEKEFLSLCPRTSCRRGGKGKKKYFLTLLFIAAR